MELIQEDNNMSVFKSYLRGLLRELKRLKEAIQAGDQEKVKEMLDKLIDDTQSGIEDN